MGSFSGVTNQIQLYKKTFNIAFLTDVSGFVLSLRYLYGCVIYLNGHEVFRNGVEGDVSASSIGLNAYTDVMYRHVSLPVRTMATAETPSVNYLQEGTNTIAIAIVAQTATQTTSYFDCAVRLMGAADSRVFDYSTEDLNMYGNPMYIADLFYGYSIAYSTCADNHLTILFNDNRREWISSVDLYLYYQQGSDHPAQFTLKARNSNLEEWTTLKAVAGMQWSLVGEHKKIWLENSKPWNQYRFENFATGNPDSCSWKLGGIDLKADAIPSTIPELSYPSPVVITRGVEMGEVYPTQDYYYDFSVTPALPEGLSLDANSGKISGTVRELMAATTYQITATKVGGGTTTASVTLSVETCSGTKSLITLVVRTDNWGYEGSYKLYSGKGKSGEVISSLNSFKVSNALNYGDFCVPHGIYTVELCDSANDGWINPAGWYLTVDVGAMIFEMGQVAYSVRSMTSLFSSYLPFQVEYDDWKVWNKDEDEVADHAGGAHGQLGLRGLVQAVQRQGQERRGDFVAELVQGEQRAELRRLLRAARHLHGGAVRQRERRLDQPCGLVPDGGRGRDDLRDGSGGLQRAFDDEPVLIVPAVPGGVRRLEGVEQGRECGGELEERGL